MKPKNGTKSIDDMPLFTDRIFSRFGRENEFIEGDSRCFNHLVKLPARNWGDDYLHRVACWVVLGNIAFP